MSASQEGVFGDFDDLTQAIVFFAGTHKQTIATAESCTGGMIAAALTSIAGASEVYKGSIVSYANEVKAGLLGVDEATLGTVGAVSEQVALEMARGACRAMGASYAVSTTGIAGPGGGTPDKPVGTVWIAVARSGSGDDKGGVDTGSEGICGEDVCGVCDGQTGGRQSQQQATLYHFAGTRTEIRRAVTEAALRDLLAFIRGSVS